jgi:hypothetical protein
MMLDRAPEIIAQQLQFGGGYNRNAVRLLQVQREHGQAAVDSLIRELDLEEAFGLKLGVDFSGVGC